VVYYLLKPPPYWTLKMKAKSKSQGFTQIPNHIFKNANWTESKFDDRHALIDLYNLAQFKDGYVFKRAQYIPLKPGQIGWSQESLADRWKWSIGKVRRFLKNMQTAGEIDMVKTNVSTTITLLYWIQNDRANEQANEQANGNQIDRQTETKRYPNNIDNTVNTDNTPIQGGGDVEKLFKMWFGDKYNGQKPTERYLQVLGEALKYQSIDKWIPLIEKRLELEKAGVFVHSSMKYWFDAGFLEMEDKGSTTAWEDKFHKCPTGLYRACCAKCDRVHFAVDGFQLRKGSECCKVELVPEPSKKSSS